MLLVLKGAIQIACVSSGTLTVLSMLCGCYMQCCVLLVKCIIEVFLYVASM